jgi:hypothetical protein
MNEIVASPQHAARDERAVPPIKVTEIDTGWRPERPSRSCSGSRRCSGLFLGSI